MKHILHFSIFFCCIVGQLNAKDQPSLQDKLQSTSLPGVLRIDDNLYLDQFELTNFNWLEYLHWNKRVFGADSDAYKNALPDSTVWKDEAGEYGVFTANFYRHPAYYNYPIIGITHAQAQAFSLWRSERVFEYLLIKYEIIEPNTDIKADNYFTIAGFYADDQYKDYHHVKYPSYTLPSVKNWTAIQKKAEAFNASRLIYCKPSTFLKRLVRSTEYCEKIVKENALFINSFERLDTTEIPLESIYRWPCSKPMFFHLYGNVAEMTKEGEYVVGGAWIDPEAKILSGEAQHYEGANAWTGFRNICAWKSYQK